MGCFMLRVNDEKLINKCLDDFLKSNKNIDILDLKLKVWNFAKLISDNGVITEDVINTILNDLSVIDEDISFKHDWKLNKEIVESDLCAKCGTCSVVCPNDLVKFKRYCKIVLKQ